jgi:hypothetical protein
MRTASVMVRVFQYVSPTFCNHKIKAIKSLLDCVENESESVIPGQERRRPEGVFLLGVQNVEQKQVRARLLWGVTRGSTNLEPVQEPIGRPELCMRHDWVDYAAVHPQHRYFKFLLVLLH